MGAALTHPEGAAALVGHQRMEGHQEREKAVERRSQLATAGLAWEEGASGRLPEGQGALALDLAELLPAHARARAIAFVRRVFSLAMP